MHSESRLTRGFGSHPPRLAFDSTPQPHDLPAIRTAPPRSTAAQAGRLCGARGAEDGGAHRALPGERLDAAALPLRLPHRGSRVRTRGAEAQNGEGRR